MKSVFASSRRPRVVSQVELSMMNSTDGLLEAYLLRVGFCSGFTLCSSATGSEDVLIGFNSVVPYMPKFKGQGFDFSSAGVLEVHYGGDVRTNALIDEVIARSCQGRNCAILVDLAALGLLSLDRALPLIAKSAARWRLLGVNSSWIRSIPEWWTDRHSPLLSMTLPLEPEEQVVIRSLMDSSAWLPGLLGPEACDLLKEGKQLQWVAFMQQPFRDWLRRVGN